MSIYAWGFGKLGQLGSGDFKGSIKPLEIKLSNGYRPSRLVTGGLFTLILTQKGDLLVCGCGKHGRLGTGDEADMGVPSKLTVARDAKIEQVAACSWHCCAITYLGRLYTWGYNSKHNVLGRQCSKSESLTPGIVEFFLDKKVKQVACGHNFTLVLTDDGTVYSWGCGRYGVLGHGNEDCCSQPTQIQALKNMHIRLISAGYAHCAAVTTDGCVYMFGKGVDGALGFGGDDLIDKTKPTWLQSLSSTSIRTVKCSIGEHRGFTLAVDEVGCVYAWGSNHKGKLGSGDSDSRFMPTKIPEKHFNNEPVVQISAGANHSAAITESGSVYTWGAGKDGRLGHREIESTPHSYHSTRPKKVLDLPSSEDAKAIEVQCGIYHTVILVD